MEQTAVDEQNENPVANGLAALVAVAVVIGLLAAIIALLGSRLFGLTGGTTVSPGDGVPAGASLYLPSLEPTELDSRLLVTLVPVETESDEPSDTTSPSEATESTTPSSSPSTSAPARSTAITLSAGSSHVDAGEELMLSGTYAQGEGSVLDIWYNVDGEGWEQFNLDVNVYGGVFQVFVATYKTGTIEWRVEDPESGRQSNVVTVHHGE